MPGIDRFLLGLLEDAALLGADDNSVADAVHAFLARRDTPLADAVGSLTVPASHVERLREEVDPDQTLTVSLYGDTGLDGLVAARELVQDDAWIMVTHVILPVRAEIERAPSLPDLLDALPFTVPTHLELAVDDALEGALDVIAADGAECAAFVARSDAELARAFVAAARRSVPVSVTCPPDRKGQVVAAIVAGAAAAAEGADVDVVSGVLGSTAPEELDLVPERASATRRLLTTIRHRSVESWFRPS